MAKFYTAYGEQPPKEFYTYISEEPIFGYVKKVVDDLDDNGKKVGSHEEVVFEITGTQNISDYVNSFESTTNIKKIFERYQMGDVSVLTQRIGDFADTVGCPTTLVDAQLMMKQGDLEFNKIPASIREKFDNSVEKFLQACADGTVLEKSGLSQQVQDDKNTINSQQDEIAKLKKLLDEGGIKYE